MARVKKQPTKVCSQCKAVLPLTADFFYKRKDSTTGFKGRCKACVRDYEARDVYKSRRNAKNKTLAAQSINRLKSKLRNYRRRDSTDFTLEELAEYLENPCTYCGTTEVPRGLDRLDNKLGHTKANTVPACWTCNRMKGRSITPEEMKLIGSVVRDIRFSRSGCQPLP